MSFSQGAIVPVDGGQSNIYNIYQFDESHRFVKYIKINNVKNVFGLGGAVAHILTHRKEKIKVTYTHHEQCASLAAVSYSRSQEMLDALLRNNRTWFNKYNMGLLAAWQDSYLVFLLVVRLEVIMYLTIKLASGNARSKYMH